MKRDVIKEQLDMDYWRKLSPEEKEWLKKFNAEFYFGFFNTGEFEKGRPNIHTDPLLKKEIRKRLRNQRNDLYYKGRKVK